MSLHPDNLVSEFEARVKGQRVAEDFLWGLLQRDSEHAHAWIGGAVNMVMADIGDLIADDQRPLWESLRDGPAVLRANHTAATAFLFFCLWQYPAFHDAAQAQAHHSPMALAFFTKQVLPGLFDDFFSGRGRPDAGTHSVRGAPFVRDVRAQYIFTVGVPGRAAALAAAKEEGEVGGENAPSGDSM